MKRETAVKILVPVLAIALSGCSDLSAPAPLGPGTVQGKWVTMAASSASGSETMYLERFTRTKGAPNSFERVITTEGFEGPFTLHVRNGEDDGSNQASSASVSLDGAPLLQPRDFASRTSSWTFPVALGTSASLRVTIASAPGSVVEVWVEGTPVAPEVWDPAVQFPRTNPDGTWSAGWTSTLGSALNLYPDASLFEGLDTWMDNTIRLHGTPMFAKNNTAGSIFGIPAGSVALHPGCRMSEYSVLRWTAPKTTTYSVTAEFHSGDGGNTSAHVLKNGDASAPLLESAPTPASYAADVHLSAGESLDFVVGAAGDCYYDSTPLTIQITG